MSKESSARAHHKVIAPNGDGTETVAPAFVEIKPGSIVAFVITKNKIDDENGSTDKEGKHFYFLRNSSDAADTMLKFIEGKLSPQKVIKFTFTKGQAKKNRTHREDDTQDGKSHDYTHSLIKKVE